MPVKKPNLKPSEHPWEATPYEIADVAAVQAISKGTATPDQQIRAIKFIVEKVCATYDMSYRTNSARDTDFAEGKRFVGNQIVKYTRLSVPSLLKRDSEQPP